MGDSVAVPALSELLKGVLTGLGAEARVMVNDVGNLAVLDAAGIYRGWIDMRTGELNWV